MGTLLHWMKKSRNKLSGMYAKFFLAISVLMFFAILAVGVISYKISYSALTNQISYEKINTLTQTRNTADVTLKEIEKIFIAESINPQLLKFSVDPFSEDHELLKQTIKTLVKIKNSNRYIFSVYVYLPQHDLIVTTEDGFWKLGEFYDLSWRDSVKKDSRGSWITTRRIQTFSGEKLGVTTYVTPIPFDEYVDGSYNLIVVNVYEKELLKLIQDQNSTSSGLSCIIDAEGRIITHRDKELLGKELKYDTGITNRVLGEKSGFFTFNSVDGKHLISHVRSEYTKWNYISNIPEKQVIKPIQNLKIINILVAVACMFFGVIAAYIISSRIYRPISNTILSAKRHMTETGESIGDKEVKNEMDFLNATIEQIADKNKKLKNIVQKNETVLREGFLLDLLLSASMDEVQLENKLRQSNISFPHTHFYILTILIDKYSSFVKENNERDRFLYSFAIKNISEEILNNHSFGMMVQTDKDKFAAVFNCMCDLDQVLHAVEEIRVNIRNILGFSVTIGVSNRCSSLSDISFLYKEAMDLAKARIVLGGDRSISSSDIGIRTSGVLLISASREEQILNHIKQGNVQEAIKNIDKIVNMIKKEPGYLPEEIHQFFYSILCISIKAVNENGWSVSDIFGDNCNLYKELVENDTVIEIKDWMNGILQKMAVFITEKKESKNYSLIDSILNYMHANYHNDIGLNFMADYVSLSTPYLSKLFKSETGENFHEYLTRLRIEKSKELLLNPEYKITAIAEKVNFGNAQNYIRIFKKYEGMTPGQYRETNIKENLNNE